MTKLGYTNTQRAPLCYLVALPGVACLIVGLTFSGEDSAPVAVTLGLSVLFFYLALAFRWLETTEHEDHLMVRFGPLPSLRKRVMYEGVREVKRDRSLLIEGWGVHLGPKGWIWNLWGRDVVELDRKEGRLRIGTDDPEGLIAHLRERCDLG